MMKITPFTAKSWKRLIVDPYANFVGLQLFADLIFSIFDIPKETYV